MNSIGEVLKTVIVEGSQYLKVGSRLGKVWSLSPYILCSISVINGLFILHKANLIKNIALSEQNIEYHKKIFKFNNITENLTKGVSLLLPSLIIIRELYSFVIKRISSEKYGNTDIARSLAMCAASTFISFEYRKFFENKLKDIKEVHPQLESLNICLRSAKSLDEAKSIIEFFENSYGNLEQIEIHGIDNLEIIKYLVEDKGADVNAKGPFFNTPLHEVNNLEVAKYLIDKGADVNAKGFLWNTPLHEVNNLEVAKYLIDKGADLTSLNSYGKTPLTYTLTLSNLQNKEFNIIDRMKILLECGADPHHKDGKGISFYMIFEKTKGVGSFTTQFQDIYKILGLESSV